MSKKRREKVKAKQRRHTESVGLKPVSAPAKLEPASKQVQAHAAPIWKAFYSAVSESASRS